MLNHARAGRPASPQPNLFLHVCGLPVQLGGEAMSQILSLCSTDMALVKITKTMTLFQ